MNIRDNKFHVFILFEFLVIFFGSRIPLINIVIKLSYVEGHFIT